MSLYDAYKKERLKQIKKMYIDSYKHETQSIRFYKSIYFNLGDISVMVLGSALVSSGLLLNQLDPKITGSNILTNDFFIIAGMYLTHSGYCGLKDTRNLVDFCKKHKDNVVKRLKELSVSLEDIAGNS